MQTSLSSCQILVGAGIAFGSACWLAVLVCALFFRSRKLLDIAHFVTAPPVSVLKPVCGLEKNLEPNLRSACLQDYPDYQVVYSVERSDDPALPMLRALEREFGPTRVTVALATTQVGPNGKINNLAGALPHARHEILVISDSDVFLRADFLKRIVAPLGDPEVGAVSTLFRGCDAGPWYEQMEQLTLNADQFAVAMVANATGLVDFCFGASTALSRQTLVEIGGFEGLADFLVEDTEMGRRIAHVGKRVLAIPYVVDTTIDLRGPAHWWQKQTYWDQNTRAAAPSLFIASLLLRIVPLALLFGAMRSWDRLGLWVIGLALVVRLSAAAMVLGVALHDYTGLRNLWLVPIKDVLSLVWFVRAFVTRTVIWRGVEMSLASDGRLTAIASKPAKAMESHR
jgi:ceramide glucosyltransferase